MKDKSEFLNRLRQFVECCDSEKTNAEVIRDAWLNGNITLIEATELSYIHGIAGPLAYWTDII